MENENCPADLLEAAATNAVIEGQIITPTKISPFLISQNTFVSLRNMNMWKDDPTLHPRMSTARHFQMLAVTLCIRCPGPLSKLFRGDYEGGREMPVIHYCFHFLCNLFSPQNVRSFHRHILKFL